MPGILGDLFGETLNSNRLRYEDHAKAKALINVIGKSAASLGDVLELADALGLQIQIQAFSKPEPETPEP